VINALEEPIRRGWRGQPRTSEWSAIGALSAEVGGKFAEDFTITTLSNFTDVEDGVGQRSSEDLFAQVASCSTSRRP
jgi:hypothetical protein